MRMKKLIAGILICIFLISLAGTAWAEDYSVAGKYKKNGYENSYFHYQVELPSDYTLEGRGLLSLLNTDVIEEANKENTLSYLKTTIDLSAAIVFTANSPDDYFAITVQSPGILNDHWADEKQIAENTFESLIDDLDSMNEEEGITVTQINGHVDTIKDFIDGKHYCTYYDCLLNGVPYYGVQIYVRSSDQKYLSIFDFMSFEEENLEKMCSYCTKLK